jgi:hypothetical protein
VKNITKIFGRVVAAFAVSALIFSGLAQASVQENYPLYSWYVTKYEVDLKPLKNGVLEVEERIVADFSDVSKRGVVRRIPYRYSDIFEGLLRYTPLTVRSVTDFDGNEWEYKVMKSGNYKSIRVGNEDVYWSEPLSYVIRYDVENAFNSFAEDGGELGALSLLGESDRDEIYWNAIDDEWYESPIGAYEVRVDLSEFTEDEILELDCFMGQYGSTENCEYDYENKIMVISGEELGYRGGITIGAAFEGGVIVPKMSWKMMMYGLVKLLFFIPVFVLMGCFAYWWKHGKDPSRKTIIPTYKLNPELRAMEVGAMIDERFNNHDVTAGLMDLAVRGYLKIEEKGKKGFFGGQKYTFKKLKDFKKDPDLLSFEKSLLSGLFGSTDTEVDSTDLVGSFYITVGTVKRKVFRYLVDQGYYKENPNSIKFGYTGTGTAIMFFSVWLSGMTSTWYLLLTLFPLGLGVLIMGPFMSKKTEHGMRVYEHILGFKDFINIAEKDRVKFFQEWNAGRTEKDQILSFETLLPYAVAFGMGDKWADLFKDILVSSDYSPNWYSGKGNFNMDSFSSSLNGISKTMRSASVPPSSSSSGGSFSSGGFSGGGFGGGGGSSW